MILLDTHAWIWWLSAPEKLSAPAQERIDQATEIGVSAISCWEVAMLVAKDRVRLDRDVLVWIHQALRQPRVRLIALEPDIAVLATRVTDQAPADPADRIIIASALHFDADLVTRDQTITRMEEVRTVW